MKIKLSDKAVNQLIAAWMDDSFMTRLGEPLRSEISYKGFYLKIHARVFISKHARLAGDALWDGDLLGAQNLLRIGLDIKGQSKVTVPQGELSRGARQHYLHHLRMSGKPGSPQHDWHYVKAVRSK